MQRSEISISPVDHEYLDFVSVAMILACRRTGELRVANVNGTILVKTWCANNERDLYIGYGPLINGLSLFQYVLQGEKRST